MYLVVLNVAFVYVLYLTFFANGRMPVGNVGDFFQDIESKSMNFMSFSLFHETQKCMRSRKMLIPKEQTYGFITKRVFIIRVLRPT